jgi:hypothetical protein
MAKKVSRLVDGPIVIGKLQNTCRAWKCSDTFVHISGMWSRWGEGKWDSRPGVKEEVAEDQA